MLALSKDPFGTSLFAYPIPQTFLVGPERLCLGMNLVWGSSWGTVLAVALVSPATPPPAKTLTLTFHTKNVGRIEQCLKVTGS